MGHIITAKVEGTHAHAGLLSIHDSTHMATIRALDSFGAFPRGDALCLPRCEGGRGLA